MGSAPAAQQIGLVLKAMNFAAEKHRFQRRKDQEASPYINHPIQVANLLVNEAGVDDAAVLAAAVLHDTVEDTQTTFEEIEAAFGPDVCAIVREVTDDTSLPKEERKRLQVAKAGHASTRAQQVKFADKICNLRDIARSPPASWSLERRREYFAWARQVVDRMRGPHGRLEVLFDEAFAAGP